MSDAEELASADDHTATVRDVLPDTPAGPTPRSIDELLCGSDSAQEPVLSVVLPTLDEEEGIADVLETLHDTIEAMGLPTEILVSDSSSDRTPEIAREYGAVVLEPENQGYGAAYRYAFDRVRGDYVVMADADCTYDFEELPALLAEALSEDADLVLGSRLQGEIRPGAMPALHRYVGNPLLTGFLNAFYDAGVSDAHSGFRVIRREALDAMDLETHGMEFASEMVMEAGARDLEIREVPITYHERAGEATLDSFRDGWRHVRFMLLNAPGYLFSVPGALMTLLGALVLGGAIADVKIGPTGLGTHSAIAGSLLTVLGTQVLGLGVFARVSGNPIRARHDPLTEPVLERVGLEQGATAGLVLFGIGAAYAALMVGQWVGSGFSRLPLVMMDIAAMTAMILGVQIVFLSFYLSAVAGD